MAIEAVGVWFYAVETKRYLYLMRSDEKHRGMWSLPGGKQEKNESLLESLMRECREEMGIWPHFLQLTPLERFTTPSNNFTYHTFFAAISSEFVPKLNHEHLGYTWVNRGIIPRPLHPGLKSTLQYREIKTKIKSLERFFD
jgi:8-oxo-dGTP pyrophosphatase MutT (NUDIX family)